ncbi:hypothetical protein VII00023_00200, partial [Vibrio ichthyoenteri ATCC 700023]
KKIEINKIYVDNLKLNHKDDCGKVKSRFGETFWAENSCDGPIGFFMNKRPSGEFIDADGKVYDKQYKTIWGHSWVYLNLETTDGFFDRLPIHKLSLPFPEVAIN